MPIGTPEWRAQVNELFLLAQDRTILQDPSNPANKHQWGLLIRIAPNLACAICPAFEGILEYYSPEEIDIRCGPFGHTPHTVRIQSEPTEHGGGYAHPSCPLGKLS